MKTYLWKDPWWKESQQWKNPYIIDEESTQIWIKTLKSSPSSLRSSCSSMGFGKESVLQGDDRKLVWSNLECVKVVNNLI